MRLGRPGAASPMGGAKLGTGRGCGSLGFCTFFFFGLGVCVGKITGRGLGRSIQDLNLYSYI